LERCPGEVVIDFDTARLRATRGTGKNKSKTLDNRCISCRTALQVSAFLDRYEESYDQPSNSKNCLVSNCRQPVFRNSGRCADHFFKRLRQQHKERSRVNLPTLQGLLKSKINEQWIFRKDSGYERILERTLEIQEGKRPGTDLVILDDEFSPTSSQLWEFAMVEKVSGKVLINAQINHERWGLDHKTPTRVENKLMESLSKAKAFQLYQRTLRRSSTTKSAHIDVDEVASKLKATGITPDTLILVWHYGITDLLILRSFLDSGGYSGILPPDSNCIPMIQLFRTNLKEVVIPGFMKPFPLTLPILFSLFFPRHSLVGLNHRALEDCLQTRLLALTYDELVKPPEARPDLRLEQLDRVSQRSIMDWLQKPVPIDPSLKLHQGGH